MSLTDCAGKVLPSFLVASRTALNWLTGVYFPIANNATINPYNPIASRKMKTRTMVTNPFPSWGIGGGGGGPIIDNRGSVMPP